jgi:hypothetical protein
VGACAYIKFPMRRLTDWVPNAMTACFAEEDALYRDAKQVLACVSRLHDFGYIHCDLKPQHFLRVSVLERQHILNGCLLSVW